MRPDPMATCPHDVPAGTRCLDCGDLFNYEFVVACRNVGSAVADAFTSALADMRRRLSGNDGTRDE